MYNTVVEWYDKKTCEDDGHFYRTPVRPEIAAFAIEMERVLQENDHKSGWKSMNNDDIFFRIQDEFEELVEAHALYAHPLVGEPETSSTIQDMRKECVDITNFCMFFWHNNKKL